MVRRPPLPLARLAGLIGTGLLLVALGAVPVAARAALPAGRSEHVVELNGVALRFFVYKPRAEAAGPLIVGFHGSDRQAPLVRDNLVPVADARDAVVVAPLLDEGRFPRWRYQWAGLVEPLRRDGQLVTVGKRIRHVLRRETDWTVRLVLGLVDHVRDREGRRDMPFYLIGHSAGAQLVGRLSAFTEHGARRVVLANAGSHLAPTRRRKFPYGFGGLPARLTGDEALRRYLTAPLTIFVGTRDRRRAGLDTSAGAERQGRTRYERGRAIYRLGRDAAASKGWPFCWRLVEADGVGHNSAHMYGSAAALDALFTESACSGEPQVAGR